MRSSNTMTFVLLAFLSAVLIAGCGGGESDSGSSDGGSSGVTTMPVEGAPFGERIAAAGFDIVQFRGFPAQLPGRDAFAIVYRKGSKGGVLYTGAQGNSGDRAVWHWYFSDSAPDSVTYLELNDDGLWDVRVHFGGKHTDFLQESDFSFFGKLRADLIAMNGPASNPDGMWQAFDGDTTTAWSAGGDSGWLEVFSPMGLRDGVLALQLDGEGASTKVLVKADGKQLSEFDLEATPLEQVFQLGDGAMSASVLRFEFSGGNVAISEVQVR